MNQDYRGEHGAPGKDTAPLWDVTLNGIYPEDFYSSQGARYYGVGEPDDAAVIGRVQGFRGRSKASVTVYRAVPKTSRAVEELADVRKQKAQFMRRGKVPSWWSGPRSSYYDQLVANEEALVRRAEVEPKAERQTINPGDWITIWKPYAVDHGHHALGGKFKIISKNVRAREVWTNGDSIFEWGYDP